MKLLVLAQAEHKTAHYVDRDGDTYGVASDEAPTSACAAPPGYAERDGDCDETNLNIHPDSPETCDALDNNCDGAIDEGVLTTFYRDVDGDGVGVGADVKSGCMAPSGYVASSGDCDDARTDVYPGASEVCDSFDNNCNGAVDEGVQITYYRDADGDGWGAAGDSRLACARPLGFVENALDCNDTTSAVYPGHLETCDGLDNDCNAQVDEGVLLTFFRDNDNDGAGDESSSLSACFAPTGYVEGGGDCNDESALQAPSVLERCDGIDNDCDGFVDESGAIGEVISFLDEDGDSFGRPETGLSSCEVAPGRVTNDGDCNDTHASISPAALESCDGIDNNCDGAIDEAGAVGEAQFYADRDHDGFGDPQDSLWACAVPSEMVANAEDCDDGNAETGPGAAELCDGFDNDCDHGVDEGCDSYIPPDPSVIAPPLNPSTETHFFDEVSFLFQNDPPIQSGVLAGAITAHRIAVVHGQVLDVQGQPLAGVDIRIAEHPEWGQTRSRFDGQYDLAVNGGGNLMVEIDSASHLPVTRRVDVPWQDFAAVDTVVLTALDPAVAEIHLTGPVEVAVSSTSTDGDGSRRSVLMFKSGTQASMRLPDGTSQPLSIMHVRSTEFTVGESGPQAMPMELPTNTAYNYAVEYSVDEAMAAGATHVEFDRPVIAYVENFSNAAVGIRVPTGFVDPERRVWLPGTYGGLVVRFNEVLAGKALFDLDGDGVSEDPSLYSGLLIDDAEREAVANLYPVGQTLWRIPLTHFSQWDHNWGGGPPNGGAPPDLGPNGEQPEDGPTCGGSIIDLANQGLGERVPVVGTPFSLSYTTRYARGRRASFQLDLQTQSKPDEPPMRKTAEMQIAGRVYVQDYLEDADGELPHALFEWDGYDRYGRLVAGLRTPSKLCMSYFYPFINAGRIAFDALTSAPQLTASTFGYNGNGLVIQGTRGSSELELPSCVGRYPLGGPVDGRESYTRASDWKLGVYDAKRAIGLGGWTLDIHHNYAPLTGTLSLGNGEVEDAKDFGLMVNQLNAFNVAGVTATQGVDVGPDGSVYVAAVTRVFKIKPDGTLVLLAGSSTQAHGGDGGLAVNATFHTANDVAIAPDGTFYVADIGAHRVRKIDQAGYISTYAGTGTIGFTTQEGLATTIAMSSPKALAVAPDGTLYLAHDAGTYKSAIKRITADGIARHVLGDFPCSTGSPSQPIGRCTSYIEDIAIGPSGRVYFTQSSGPDVRVARIEPSGQITTIAGGGSLAAGTDEVLATDVELGRPWAVAVASDGTVFFSDTGVNNSKIRSVDPQGFIHSVAGTGQVASSGDGGPAGDAKFRPITRIAIHPDSSLIVSERDVKPVRRISSSTKGYDPDTHFVPNKAGTEVYIFDREGRHLETRDAITGTLIYAFSYTNEGWLAFVADSYGQVTAIERDAASQPVAIVSSNGVRTELAVDSEGNLALMVDPQGAATEFEYGPGGLLTMLRDPRRHEASFEYDEAGRLIKDTDKGGGFKTLSRIHNATGSFVEIATKMGRRFANQITLAGVKSKTQSSTDSAGLQTTSIQPSPELELITYPDGTKKRIERKGDPRFGMHAPVTSLITQTLPSGAITSSGESRSVTLTDPLAPLSVQSWSSTYTQDTRTWTRSYEASTRIWTLRTPENRVSTTTLGEHDEVLRAQSGTLAPVTMSYDDAGRLLSITQSSGLVARTMSQTYDSRGYLASISDPLGRTTRFEVDDNGRTTKQILPDLREIAFAYDDNGNLTSLTPPSRPEHAFSYNAMDDAELYLPPVLPDVAMPQTSYLYDDDHRLNRIVRPDGQTIDLVYDPQEGRLMRIENAERTPIATYDLASGLPSQLSNQRGASLSYTYDGSRRLSETSHEPDLDGTDQQVSWTDDANARVASERINEAEEVAYTYNNDDELIGLGAMSLVRDPANAYVVDAALGLLSTSYTYDEFGAPVGLQTMQSGATLQNLSLTRDKLGRVKSRRDVVAGASQVRCYEYDASARLTKVFDGITSGSCSGMLLEEYRYDANSNRIYAKNDAGIIDEAMIEVDAQDRLLRYGDLRFIYSANGEISRKENVATGEAQELSYDVFGNLTRAILANGDVIDFSIDPRNRRVGKTINGTPVQRFVYGDQLEPIAQLDGAGELVSRFVYRPGSHFPEYMTKGGVTDRFVVDHLGSVLAVVDAASGVVVQRMEYDAWGRVVEDTNPGFQPFGFAGGIWERDVGLVRFGARDYDPELGRWTAKDPIGFGGGLSIVFGYTGDPINLVDPSGLDVYLCMDPAQIPGNPGFVHHWIRTDSREAGLGSCGYSDPGRPNRLAELPSSGGFLQDTCLVPHDGRSQSEVAQCERQANVNELCVDKELSDTNPQGPWFPGLNDCQSAAEDILEKCRVPAAPAPWLPFLFSTW